MTESAITAMAAAGMSVSEPDTNIVMLTSPDEAVGKPLLDCHRARGVCGSRYGGGRIRFVLDAAVRDEDIARAARVIVECARRYLNGHTIEGERPGTVY
ncbi:MAG TPA: hypothetical protein VEP50_17870 [bacterium]|nr:hypothetical protein [bacterium]